MARDTEAVEPKVCLELSIRTFPYYRVQIGTPVEEIDDFVWKELPGKYETEKQATREAKKAMLSGFYYKIRVVGYNVPEITVGVDLEVY